MRHHFQPLSKLIILPFLLAIIFTGCQQKGINKNINFSTKGPQNTPDITLESSGLKKPLSITAGQSEGSIFFETDEGVTWLSGQPEMTEATEAGWSATWNVNDRNIDIAIEQSGQNFDVSFTASPNDDILGWGFNLSATQQEYFTGLLERTVDGHQDLTWSEDVETRMDLRGESVEMLVQPTLGIYAPFFISSIGYGVFVKGTWPGKYDMCDTFEDLVQIQHSGPSLEFTIYTSDDPASIVKQHAQDAGLPILLPKWTFSHWRWRDNNHNGDEYYDGTKVDAPYNSMLVEDVLMLEALDIPWGAYWVDRPWANGPSGYDDFEWDEARFPKVNEMIDWIRDKDKKFMLWIAPWVKGDMAVEAMQKGYFLPAKGMASIGITKASLLEDNSFVESLRPKIIDFLNNEDENGLRFVFRRYSGSVNADEASVPQMRKILAEIVENADTEKLKGLITLVDLNRALIDFTNPEAKTWWQEKGLRKVLEDSVAGFKLDRSEELVPARRDVYAYDGRSTHEIRNDYPVQYVEATYEISKEIRGDDFVLFPRAAYTGSAQYSGFWGGDIRAPKEGLRGAIIAQLRSSIIGYPLWGSDIGGYWGGFDREVSSRWLAFGCFSPIMEVGPLLNRGLWDLPDEPGYDPEFLAVYRLYATLHTELMDYTYKYAKEAHETGMPISRPLYLAYPDQEKAWSDWQTFLYGDDILVSAIWQTGKTTHECYLPKGNKWIDAWDTEKIYNGGQMVSIETPVHKIPIFIREGSNTKLPDLNELYEASLEITQNKPDIKELETKAFR